MSEEKTCNKCRYTFYEPNGDLGCLLFDGFIAIEKMRNALARRNCQEFKQK